jgi:RluA family pseudouridine synthase
VTKVERDGEGAPIRVPAGPPRRLLRVGAEDDDRPLADFLARRCPEVPAGFLKKLLRKGFVRVGRDPVGLKERVEAGQTVKLYLPEGSYLVAPNPDVPYRTVLEENAFVVVDKPAGVVSEPGIGHKLDTLLNGLVARYGEAMDRLGPECDFGMVHRLDRDTSGLLVVARKADAWRALTRQFRRRSVEKRYLLLAVGRLADREGRIDLPLGRSREHGRLRGAVGGPASRRASTSYRVLERFANATLVEARPHTGRWHQVRLHFSALGCPVAGDAEHGDGAANERLQSQAGLERLFLHAAELSFRHPENERLIEARSGLPSELTAALERLRGR